MQNLTEGQSVAYEGKAAKVLKVHPYTIDILLEDGSKTTVFKNAVSPRDFLTESN
jgi:preprotein translocase subunit YajC